MKDQYPTVSGREQLEEVFEEELEGCHYMENKLSKGVLEDVAEQYDLETGTATIPAGAAESGKEVTSLAESYPDTPVVNIEISPYAEEAMDVDKVSAYLEGRAKHHPYTFISTHQLL